MQSFFQKYHDFQRKKQISTLVWAFVLAIGCNALIFSGTTSNLQASITNIGTSYTSHLQSTQTDTELSLQTNTELSDVEAFHTTLLYDASSISIDRVESAFGEVITLSNQAPYTISIYINPSKDIDSDEQILQVYYTRTSTQHSEINLVDTFIANNNNAHFPLSVESN